MSPLEIVAALLLLVNVALVALRSIWNYPFALAGTALYVFVFFEARLYSDALLQLFFIAINLYGWWYWLRARAAEGEVAVARLGWPARGGWLAGSMLAALGWGWLMHRYTDASMPWWDAGVAITSVSAQILQSRRRIECWVLWIIADLLAVPLYALKGLWPTCGLYLLFLLLAVWGLITWGKANKAAP